MHFVDRSSIEEPQELKVFRDEYSDVWIEYVRLKKAAEEYSQPSDNLWTDKNVRLPLYNLFLGNCGYCGDLTHIDAAGTETRFYGHVDHYIPKSEDGSKVYCWNNYIWSCKDCNEKKGSHFKKPYILNPTVKSDVEILIYEGIQGKYKIRDEFIDSEKAEAFTLTCSKTLLNICSKAQERKNTVFSIIEKLNTILEFSGSRSQHPDIEKFVAQAEGNVIKLIKENQSFKLLVREEINRFFSFHSFESKCPLIYSEIARIL